MIRDLEITNFKSFRHVKLEFGHLNLFIGANASGKSNFFDALRVLQGIGYGFTVDETLNGKPKGAASEVWEGIRGGAARAAFVSKDGTTQAHEPTEFSVGIGMHDDAGANGRYTLGVLPAQGTVVSERLDLGDAPLYKCGDREGDGRAERRLLHFVGGQWRRRNSHLERGQSMLAQAAAGADPTATFTRTLLADMQQLDPRQEYLRDYPQVRTVGRMGERGENFAALIDSIMAGPDGEHYVAWLRELTPHEVDDVVLLRGALGEPFFAIREGEVIAPATILSGGTLRFAALAAAFFQPDMPGIITMEEIEDGIHPTRLRLLVELLKSQSRIGPQVFAITHSPLILAWLRPEDYATTFYCWRDVETGESHIKPLTEIPHLMEIVGDRNPLDELYAQGWMETVL
jgi:predicted ATPase